MGKKPEFIYTDDEKAIASGEFQVYVENEGIELYRRRGHPVFAELFIKKIKTNYVKELRTMKRI